ncbi:Mu transposase domain-containing protein [Streptosporangium roseum]|uniref:Mu transposase domain-containing protein n=1 Tax=Streptosporangium roseum TaxID=2001 RepID=UPI0033252D64
MPEEHFETGRTFYPRVDRRSQINVRSTRYSVPVAFIGRQVKVLLHSSELLVFADRKLIARHERLIAKDSCRLDLDHYLEVLIRKPGALPGSTALDQARQAGKFTPVHDAWWSRVREAHGDANGTRELIQVLLLHRTLAHEHVVAGIAAALQVGALSADVVAIEARNAAQADAQPSRNRTTSKPADRTVELPDDIVSLTHKKLTSLPPDTRPLPSVAAYDQLLRRSRPPQTGESS